MKTEKILHLLLILAGMSITTFTMAQPGALDPSFNGTGYAIHSMSNTWSYPMALCVTPEGEILTGGYKCDTTQHPNVQNLMILRYNSDGSPDLGFGVNGVVTTDYSSSALGLTVQSDGKILVAGQSKTGSQAKGNFTLFRLNPDGTFDNSFGQGGIVQDTLGSWASAVTILPDGRILAAGVGYTTGSTSFPFFLLASHHADGTPDTTFGNAGFITTQIWRCTGAYALGMVIQPDGKILLGDEVKIGSKYCMAMLRYNPDGSLDPGFGTGGLVLDSAGLRNGCYKLAVQPNGKILVPGYVYLSDLTHPQYSLFRYNPDGSRDSTYHGDGHNIGEGGAAYDIMIQPDGKIVTCGNLKNDSTIKRGIVKRYLSSGDPDPAFGINGTADLDIEKPGGMITLALAPDGKIVTTGYCNEVNSPLWRNTLTVRLNTFGLEVSDAVTNETVNISPNPFRDNVRVEAAGLAGSVITVTSMQGCTLFNSTMQSDQKTINLDFLPTGMYIIRIISEGTACAKQIIKL